MGFLQEQIEHVQKVQAVQIVQVVGADSGRFNSSNSYRFRGVSSHAAPLQAQGKTRPLNKYAVPFLLFGQLGNQV